MTSKQFNPNPKKRLPINLDAFLYKLNRSATPRVEPYIINISEVVLALHSLIDSELIYLVEPESKAVVINTSRKHLRQYLIRYFESISDAEQEHFYARLIIANTLSKVIGDRGRFRQLYDQCRHHLLQYKGGFDYHLSMGKGRTILYIKYRQLSIIRLLAVVMELVTTNHCHFLHINLPSVLPNSEVFKKLLSLWIPSQRIKYYTYNPGKDDEILPYSYRKLLTTVIKYVIK